MNLAMPQLLQRVITNSNQTSFINSSKDFNTRTVRRNNHLSNVKKVSLLTKINLKYLIGRAQRDRLCARGKRGNKVSRLPLRTYFFQNKEFLNKNISEKNDFREVSQRQYLLFPSNELRACKNCQFREKQLLFPRAIYENCTDYSHMYF